MWWIIILVVAVIVVLTITISIIVAINQSNKYRDSDRGTQVGGYEDISAFTPANEKAGIWGENIISDHLRPLIKTDEYLLVNVLLPLKNNRKTEIDFILISRKGLFCIEAKNWVGCICGSDDDEYWIQQYGDPNKEDQKHMNPVKQNKHHCRVLEKTLNNKYSATNVVIFADLDYKSYIDSLCTFTTREFKRYYDDLSDDELDTYEIKDIFQKLRIYVATPEELNKHKEEVRNHFKNN